MIDSLKYFGINKALKTELSKLRKPETPPVFEFWRNRTIFVAYLISTSLRVLRIDFGLEKSLKNNKRTNINQYLFAISFKYNIFDNAHTRGTAQLRHF